MALFLHILLEHHRGLQSRPPGKEKVQLKFLTFEDSHCLVHYREEAKSEKLILNQFFLLLVGELVLSGK